MSKTSYGNGQQPYGEGTGGKRQPMVGCGAAGDSHDISGCPHRDPAYEASGAMDGVSELPRSGYVNHSHKRKFMSGT